MQKPTDTGMNRTGIATHPIGGPRTVKAAEQAHTGAETDGKMLEAERVTRARSADPVGTVPPPTTVKGLAKTLLEKAEGHKPTVFIDKLGERLAFERTGTRLYDALMAKFEAADVHEGGPTRHQLERIRADEHRHMLIVRDAILQVGADPTAMTPSADIVAVSGLGWVQALSDPRTTLTQCLDVILMAELADLEGWSMLIELADGLGFDDLGMQFRTAMIEEEDHLTRVRGWVAAALLGQAGVEPTPPRPDVPTAA
jgi:rubrerythrin